MFKSKILALVLCVASAPALAAIHVFNSSGAELGHFADVTCGSNFSCSQVAGKLLMTTATSLVGNLVATVNATATTITAAQCGSTFLNTGAVVINLPEASAVIGCRLTFITANASNFDVNPDDADQILVLTNAVGDAIRNATLGNSVVLQAISAVNWAPVGATNGTYTDIN